MDKTRINSMLSKWALFTAAVMTAALVSIPVAFAEDGQFGGGEWVYDEEECGGVERIEPATVDPAAFMMLDRSGSMDFWYEEWCTDSDPDWNSDCGNDGSHLDENDRGWCCGASLWEVAEGAITQTVDAMHEELFFGLGFFAGSSAWVADKQDGTPLEASADSWEDIAWALGQEDPSGRTPTDEAIETTTDSDTLNDPQLASAGLIITDGQPNDEDDAIDMACERRDDYRLYSVGLGGGTDQDLNDILAAAMGTGYCCEDPGDDCAGDPDAQIDPCDDFGDGDDALSGIDWEEGACTGSHHAYSQTQFRNLLMAIGAEIQCTFPLDDSGWEDGIPDDPEAAKVELEGAEATIEVPHVSQSSGEGCDDETDFCHTGLCRDPTEPKACDTNDDCSLGDFCHEVYGCYDDDDFCESDEQCQEDGGYSCWHNLCVHDEESVCDIGDHEYCREEFDDDHACIDGKCLDTTNYVCPYGDSDWLHGCDNPDDWCHEQLGCIDDETCSTNEGCGTGEICWYGACVDADEGHQCESGGWEYADEDRDSVTLSPNWCAEALDEGEVEEVVTQVACSCHDLYQDNWCLVPANESGNLPPGCPAGRKDCQDDQTYKCEQEETFGPGETGCHPEQEICFEGQCVDRDDLCEPLADEECEAEEVCLDGVCYHEDEVCLDGEDSSCPGALFTDGVCVEQRCYELSDVEFCENNADCGENADCHLGVCIDEEDDDYCVSCPFACPAGEGGQACTDECDVSFEPGSIEDEEDEGELIVDCPVDVEPAGAKSRCNVGLVRCDGSGFAICDMEDGLRPMPELCDGLDNSCDGQVDNIDETWEQWRNCEGPWSDANWDEEEWGDNPCGLEIEDHEDYPDGINEGGACFEQGHSCRCPDSEEVHHGTGDGEDQFFGHVGAWTSTDGCQCVAQ